MDYVTIIVMLALIQFLYFGVAVGRARARHGVVAPATHGDEVFERFHRAHQNTLEQLIVFIPSIYATAFYANVGLAVCMGVLFLVSRIFYFRMYITEPSSRARAMILTMAANIVLIIAGLVGALREILT